MIEKLNKNLGRINPYVAGATKEETALKHGLNPESIIKLASNENPFGPSPKAIDAIKKNASLVSLYPRDYPLEMIKAISSYAKVSEDMIIPGGNGADEVMDMVINMLVSSGDEVIIHTPTFPYYTILTKIHGGNAVEVPMLEDFRFPVDEIIGNINNKTKLIIICSPNNPTGNVIGEDEIRTILETGIPVMLDEAYVEFTAKSLTLLSLEFDNLIVLRTFSKVFGLAGLRVGYGVANKDFVREAMKIKPPHNVNLLAQKAVIASLEDLAYTHQVVEKIIEEREKLFRNLSNLSELTVHKSEGNFLLITFQEHEADWVVEQLEKKGIIVRGCKAFGLKNSIRVSIGTPEENQAFLNTLSQVIG